MNRYHPTRVCLLALDSLRFIGHVLIVLMGLSTGGFASTHKCQLAAQPLSVFCALNDANDGLISTSDAYHLDKTLKSYGIKKGIGHDKYDLVVEANTIELNLVPSIRYDENINGGNPAKPLIIGPITFEGDKTKYKKNGGLIGFEAGLAGRLIYGEGRYIDYYFGTDKGYSPEHSMEVLGDKARLCSLNHIASWWYLNGCGAVSRTRKELTDTTVKDLSLTASHIYLNNSRYNQLNVGINRYIPETYEQDRLVVGLDTIYSDNFFTSISVSLGEPIINQLHEHLSVSLSSKKIINNKLLSFSANYTDLQGEVLLGVEREDTAKSISLSYPIMHNLTAVLGYKSTSSTIDYFDISEPFVGIQFSSIQF